MMSADIQTVARVFRMSAKNDARKPAMQHDFGCRCLACDKREYPCPVDGCGYVAVGKVQQANHRARHKKAAAALTAREAKIHNMMVKPAGLDFVTALLGDPVRASRLDLQTVRALHYRLFGQTRMRKSSPRKIKHMLADLAEQEAPHYTLRITMPKESMAVICKLALLSGTTPTTVGGAIVAWGIEKFAEDVRTAKGVPDVQQPERLLKPAPTKAAAFPRDEDEHA